jgi:hypothetical protein
MNVTIEIMDQIAKYVVEDARTSYSKTWWVAYDKDSSDQSPRSRKLISLFSPLSSNKIVDFMATCSLVKDLVIPHLYAHPRLTNKKQVDSFVRRPAGESYVHVRKITWSAYSSKDDEMEGMVASMLRRVEKVVRSSDIGNKNGMAKGDKQVWLEQYADMRKRGIELEFEGCISSVLQLNQL